MSIPALWCRVASGMHRRQRARVGSWYVICESTHWLEIAVAMVMLAPRGSCAFYAAAPDDIRSHCSQAGDRQDPTGTQAAAATRPLTMAAATGTHMTAEAASTGPARRRSRAEGRRPAGPAAGTALSARASLRTMTVRQAADGHGVLARAGTAPSIGAGGRARTGTPGGASPPRQLPAGLRPPPRSRWRRSHRSARSRGFPPRRSRLCPLRRRPPCRRRRPGAASAKSARRRRRRRRRWRPTTAGATACPRRRTRRAFSSSAQMGSTAAQSRPAAAPSQKQQQTR